MENPKRNCQGSSGYRTYCTSRWCNGCHSPSSQQKQKQSSPAGAACLKLFGTGRFSEVVRTPVIIGVPDCVFECVFLFFGGVLISGIWSPPPGAFARYSGIHKTRHANVCPAQGQAGRHTRRRFCISVHFDMWSLCMYLFYTKNASMQARFTSTPRPPPPSLPSPCGLPTIYGALPTPQFDQQGACLWSPMPIWWRTDGKCGCRS